MTELKSVLEVAGLIGAGKRLLLAGDEGLLRQLPRGNWIGGTIPYFMGEQGGVLSESEIQVTELPAEVEETEIRFYAAGELERIPGGYLPNGFSYILIPAFSEALQRFAEGGPSWEGIFDQPRVGWVTGVNLTKLGKATPKVINGLTGEISEEAAAVMHARLAEGKIAEAHILNLFSQGKGDTITFPEAGFAVSGCQINGEPGNLAKYVSERGIDTKLPLVADYLGAQINVSFQSVDAAGGTVQLYAPVFPGVEYRIAEPVPDYEAAFEKKLQGEDVDALFSCNCILNYLYANLEGRKTGELLGPITFGEIAYMLLNQTLVYLTIRNG